VKLLRVLAVAAAVAACAACGNPAGVDGDLTDDWHAMPEPHIVVPVVGTCYISADFDLASTPTQKAPCDERHSTETVYVGQFADRTTPPPENGLDEQRAFAECGKAASAYVGADWHNGPLRLLFDTPAGLEWDVGRRYYRCDLFEISSGMGHAAARTGSLKGALTGDRPLATGCANLVSEDELKRTFDDLSRTDCTEAHRVEFTGFLIEPDSPYPPERDRTLDLHCQAKVADFLGITAAALRERPDVSWIAWPTDEGSWKLGDRAVYCYAITRRPVQRSLHDLGNRRV